MSTSGGCSRTRTRSYRREVMLTWNEDVRLAIAENRDIKPREYDGHLQERRRGSIIEISGIELEGRLARDLQGPDGAKAHGAAVCDRPPPTSRAHRLRSRTYHGVGQRPTHHAVQPRLRAADGPPRSRCHWREAGVLFPDGHAASLAGGDLPGDGRHVLGASRFPSCRADGAVRTVLWNSANVFDTDGRRFWASWPKVRTSRGAREPEDDLRRERLCSCWSRPSRTWAAGASTCSRANTRGPTRRSASWEAIRRISAAG